MLIPLTLTTRLGAITADLAPATLDARVGCRDAARACRARGLGQFALVAGAWRWQGQRALKGVEHRSFPSVSFRLGEVEQPGMPFQQRSSSSVGVCKAAPRARQDTVAERVLGRREMGTLGAELGRAGDGQDTFSSVILKHFLYGRRRTSQSASIDAARRWADRGFQQAYEARSEVREGGSVSTPPCRTNHSLPPHPHPHP
jgi:hypothetical protein